MPAELAKPLGKSGAGDVELIPGSDLPRLFLHLVEKVSELLTEPGAPGPGEGPQEPASTVHRLSAPSRSAEPPGAVAAVGALLLQHVRAARASEPGPIGPQG